MFFAATATCFMIVACGDSGKVYSHYEDIAGSDWEKTDTLTFELPKLKNAGIYRPVVMVRTNDNYGYQNLNMLVRIYSDKLLRTDTLTFDIFDSKGRNKGDGLVHTEFSKTLQPIELDTLEYTVKILNLMTESPLEGVSGVGFAL